MEEKIWWRMVTKKYGDSGITNGKSHSDKEKYGDYGDYGEQQMEYGDIAREEERKQH